MSRYNVDRNPELVLAAAQEWKNRCLLRPGSMFGDEPVWQPEYIDEFERDFVQHPDETKRSFYEKLAGQLSESRPEVKKLASEMFWVMMLCPLNIGAKKKREGKSGQRRFCRSDSMVTSVVDRHSSGLEVSRACTERGDERANTNGLVPPANCDTLFSLFPYGKKER